MHLFALDKARIKAKIVFITFQKQIRSKTQKSASYNIATINDKKQENYGKHHF